MEKWYHCFLRRQRSNRINDYLWIIRDQTHWLYSMWMKKHDWCFYITTAIIYRLIHFELSQSVWGSRIDNPTINMFNSCLQLNDLPDEIFLIIFKKLNNVDLLYSFFDVHKRLNRILYDPIFLNHLSLLNRDSNDCIYRLFDWMLGRYCLEILPSIHNKIEWLDLESSSMRRILLCTDYPNLHRLGLYNLDKQLAKHLVSGKIFFFSFN